MSFVLHKVTFGYPNAPNNEISKVISLRDVSATLDDDEIIVVLGPSGCGKTTLLNLLSLLLEERFSPDKIKYRGGGELCDYHELNNDPERRSRLRRDHFGVVLQNCYLLPHLNCLQNVCMPLALQGWEEHEQIEWAEALIQNAGKDLHKVRESMPRAVSVGQKQRIAVLRAVAHNPRIVFADEPTSNLDSASTQAILQMLLDWQSGELHDIFVKSLLGSPVVSKELRKRLEPWQRHDTNSRILFLVCHQFEPVKPCADRVLLLDENHCAVEFLPDVTKDPKDPDRWSKLDAELAKIPKLELTRKNRQ